MRPTPPLAGCALTILVALWAVGAAAQETPPSPAPAAAAEEEPRSTGLPGKGALTFNLEAGLGGFGFANSLYTNVRPDPSGDLGDNWAESFVKPALSARFRVGRSEVYGALSAVGERTFAAPPPLLVGESASSFKIEDLSLGWRSGKSVGTSENLLDFTVGRTPYTLGHGFLLWDGAGEGGSRGGYWSNARKAWQFAAVGRLKPGNHTFEVFYLDRDDLPESETGTRLWGANYEFSISDTSTFGATYLKFKADGEALPGRDGLNVLNARAFTHPLTALPGLLFELEYAREENGERLASDAYAGLVSYEMSGVGWKPRLSYRHARFEGDDPTTETNEGFDALLPGFTDWGAWWQGEIAGEYFVSNSNLVSHQVRLHLAPREAIGTGLIFYKFLADQAAGLGPEVTSRDVAFEMDWYMDWEINSNFTLSLVGAHASPGQRIEQAYGRTKSFTYGMAYLAYSY
jgi:hypothetical protein